MEIRDIMSNFNTIYNWMSDDLSKNIYINRVNWLITGERKYLAKIVELSHPEIPVWNNKMEKEFVEELPQNKKIVLYGAGSFAERIVPYLKDTDVLFCDNDKEKQKNGFYGYEVISPVDLINFTDEKAIIICTTKYMQEVQQYLLENGVNKEDIIDIRAYFKCGTGDEYFYEDFLKYSDNEIFIDAGCYDLGTTIELKKVQPGLTKAYAFEPDAHNYKKCLYRMEKQKDKLPEVVMLPYGTWSEKTELCFDSSADGCSHIGEGKTIIKTATIDETVAETDKVTFIKMDVEGAELESLKGAKRVIQRDNPKLAICIYHKPEDVITLPIYIKQLVPEYNFYLRSYSNADNEMVLYAVV